MGTYKGFRGDPKVLTCEVEGETGKMSGDKPTCNIRRLYDGTKCVFPVKYKEEIIDDCVAFKRKMEPMQNGASPPLPLALLETVILQRPTDEHMLRIVCGYNHKICS